MPGTTATSPPQPSIEAENNSEQPSEDLLNVDKNEDYQSVLQALQVLKQQLAIATSDVQVLGTLKSEALADPYSFISNLRKKSKDKMPKLQKVVAVPDINWNKYRFLPESRIVQQQAALNDLILQAKKSAYCSILDTTAEYISTPSTTPTAAKSLQQELAKATQAMLQIPFRASSVSDISEDEADDIESLGAKAAPRSIRGIVSSDRKLVSGKGKGKRRTSTVQTGRDLQASSMEVSEAESPAVSRLQSMEPPAPDEYTPTPETNSDDSSRVLTFNQPWSDQEQQRLQELLITFPDEPVQAQRFNKISKALGTRTPRQVASRVQKYFIKLAKMGLPVPGRITIPPSCMPKTDITVKKPKAKSKAKNTQGRISKPSAPPVLRTSGIGYNSIMSGGFTKQRISGGHYANTSGPPAVYMSDDEEDTSVKEMMRNAAANGATEVVHEGYACDSCGAEPIVGVLYKCVVCDVSEEVDLCGSCMEKGTFTNDHHTLDHSFEAVRTANPLPYYADDDYKSPEHLGEYSYLGF
ncbi:hypothetical protein BD408DRAFT_407915 [Parasitella parasitica]|nr:hypothetical protein BD408DRAFT_407915 [Parasitella parasitica]